MTKEQISKYAFMNELPEGIELTCPERCLWYALRDVYRRFASGELTKEQGDAEKNKSLRQFDLDTGELIQARKILQRNSNMWMEIELAGSAYGMDRTLENADAFFQAVYGVKLKQREGDRV